MNTYRIIFAGTPSFSAVALKALLDSSHEIIAVYTQPDRPAGRGQKLTASPVKELALQSHLPVYQPVTLRDEKEQKIIADLNADLMIVAAYGLLLPKPVLEAPRWGCINIHASLLPRWRGAAPIQHAIMAGDTTTGISIMKMDEGLDTGPLLIRLMCPILPDETSASLYDKLAELGTKALSYTLDHLHNLPPVAQNDEKGLLKITRISDSEHVSEEKIRHSIQQEATRETYATKIKKEAACLDWRYPAKKLFQIIRGLNPEPVAFFMLEGKPVRVWKATVIEKNAHQRPGVVVNVSRKGIDIATGENILRLLELQFPGGKRLPVSEILNSQRFLSLFRENHLLE